LLTIDELKELIDEHQILQAMHATTIFYGLQKLGQAQW
jgi:hypothetical protein